MKIYDVSYPLRLNPENIESQIETIGMAFNRFNDLSIKSKSFRCSCIALNKTKIISIGINRAKTNPNFAVYAKNNCMTIHAEIDMIMNIERSIDFKKTTDIYVIRGYSKLLPSFPCELCLGYLLRKFRSKCKLHYFTENGWKEDTLEKAMQVNI